MPDDNQQLENILFDNPFVTTGVRDFRYGNIEPKVNTVYKEKSTCMRMRPPPLKYFHTMDEWKCPSLPMDLYLKPKAIVRTNPLEAQQPYERPPDLDIMEVRKTRPRLVMTPAVSVDDMENEEERQILLKNIYMTSASKSMKDVADLIPIKNVQSPFPGLPAVANPFVIPKLNPSYVSPEWRMDSVTWDKKRLRTYCHPTKQFWLDQPSPRCRACREYETMKAYTTKRRQMTSRNRK